MVSEQSILRPTSTESAMANESDDDLTVLKFAPRSRIHLSNLKEIIDEHFNLPNVQVRRVKNGGVLLTGLFDGIPDDVETQDHESFDEINKLLGWIAGSIELPELIKSAASKDFKKLKTDEVVIMNEEPAQLDAMSETIVVKEPSKSVAHHMFDKMPMVNADHEMKTLLDQIGKVVDELLLLMASDKRKLILKALKVSDLKSAKALVVVKNEFTDLIIVLNAFPTQGGITMDHVRVVSFDPGGELILIGDSLNVKFTPRKNSGMMCKDKELASMTNLHRAAFGFVEDQSTLLTSRCELAQVVKGSYLAMLTFDPGGIALIFADTLLGTYELVSLENNSSLCCTDDEVSEMKLGKGCLLDYLSTEIENYEAKKSPMAYLSTSGEAGKINGESHSFNTIVHKCAHRKHKFDYTGVFAFDPGGQLSKKVTEPLLREIPFMVLLSKLKSDEPHELRAIDPSADNEIQSVVLCKDYILLQESDWDVIYDNIIRTLKGAQISIDTHNEKLKFDHGYKVLMRARACSFLLERRFVSLDAYMTYTFGETTIDESDIEAKLLELIDQTHLLGAYSFEIIANRLGPLALEFDQTEILQLIESRVCKETKKRLQWNYCAAETDLKSLGKFNHYYAAAAGFLPAAAHLCVGILIFDPGGVFLLQIKVVGRIFIYFGKLNLILLALSSPLNLSKYQLMKRMLILNVFVKRALISASYSRGLHMQFLKEGNLGVLKSTNLLIHYVAHLAIAYHWSWIVSENSTNVSSLNGGMNFDSCILYALDSLLVALDTFSLVEVGSTRFIFDPGGEYSKLTSKVHHARFQGRPPHSYLCFTILVVRCSFRMCCYKPNLGAVLLILEDKDPLKEGVLMQDYSLSNHFMLSCILLS